MAIEHSGYGVAPVDRSTALSELQAVCQRILTGGSSGDGGSLAPSLIATANGSAVASSLEALRRQCVENHQQVELLRRAVDGLKGIVAGDSADNAKLLVELRRAVRGMTDVLDGERQETAQLVRSVESLRVGLAGFSANNRQQVTELRGSLHSLEQAVIGLDTKIDSSVAAMGTEVTTAVGALGRQFDATGAALGRQFDATGAALGTQVEATVGALGHQVEATVAALGTQVGTALAAMGEQITSALNGMAGQIQAAFNGFGQQIGEQMTEQGGAFDSLLGELKSQAPRERLNELEQVISVALPQFSQEIQASVQDTLLAVSRTFRLAEREHGNRMAELHRDFDATARRLEAAIQPRRREESIG